MSNSLKTGRYHQLPGQQRQWMRCYMFKMQRLVKKVTGIMNPELEMAQRWQWLEDKVMSPGTQHR